MTRGIGHYRDLYQLNKVQVASHMGNIEIGPWANFPHCMDRTLYTWPLRHTICIVQNNLYVRNKESENVLSFNYGTTFCIQFWLIANRKKMEWLFLPIICQWLSLLRPLCIGLQSKHGCHPFSGSISPVHCKLTSNLSSGSSQQATNQRAVLNIL